MRRKLLCLLPLLLFLTFTGQAQESAEQQIVALSNAFRQKHGLPALVVSGPLRSAARTHSEEMARLGYFDHESPNAARRYPWDRVALAGADADSMSENIFEANGTAMAQIPALALQSWENSAEHRANLLDPTKTHVGVGIASNGKHILVTQVLSSPVTDR